jgi:hypothetical protein
MMKNKKLGLVALVIAALLISSVAAWEILGTTRVNYTDYSVKATTAGWKAYGSDWVDIPLALHLGELNGAESGYASGYIKVTVTTYALINVVFWVSSDSALSGLKLFEVKIWRGGNLVADLTTVDTGVTDAPSGSLEYVYTIEAFGTAVDSTPSAISGYINLYATVQAP